MSKFNLLRMPVAAAVTAIFLLLAAPAFAEEKPGGDLTVTIDFSGSLVSVDNDGRIDSLTDMGFGDDGESSISFSYEGEFFGGTATLAFPGESAYLGFADLPWFDREHPLASLDELYAWVKPFGGAVKFTGGIFENTDGLGLYNDDIDDFALGVFYPAQTDEGDTGFHEPDSNNNAYLVNGFLTDLTLGPATLQLLLAPNYDKSTLLSDFGSSSADELGERLFRIGARAYVDAGFGVMSAFYKSCIVPISTFNAYVDELNAQYSASYPHYPGNTVNFQTFGVYADITAVENLGLTVGYSGWMHLNDDSGWENPLWSGVDLRAAWTGIEGLSLSTHHNISFAKGVEKDWYGTLSGTDASFLSLYNAVGFTKELTGKFSVNGEAANILVKHTTGGASTFYDNFWAEAKLIAAVTENASFTAGLKVSAEMTGEDSPDETVTVFSIPVGIMVSF